MDKTQQNRTVQFADKASGTGEFTKSQSLHLNKQTIRTLTGAELRLVGGGSCGSQSNRETR